MRAVTVAAVRVAPAAGPLTAQAIEANIARALALVRDCVAATGAERVGNPMIVTPIAEVVARAAAHECRVSARLDPATAMSSLTPGSSVPQPFEHLADRNLGLIRRPADALPGDAATEFRYGPVRAD